MKLKPHSGSDKSYIWTTAADMSDGAPNQEMLAIRFSKFEGLSFYYLAGINTNLVCLSKNLTEAEQFKKLFEEVQQELRKNQSEVGKSRD